MEQHPKGGTKYAFKIMHDLVVSDITMSVVNTLNETYDLKDSHIYYLLRINKNNTWTREFLGNSRRLLWERRS